MYAFRKYGLFNFNQLFATCQRIPQQESFTASCSTLFSVVKIFAMLVLLEGGCKQKRIRQG